MANGVLLALRFIMVLLVLLFNYLILIVKRFAGIMFPGTKTKSMK